MADYVQANSGGVQAAYTKDALVQANMGGVQVAYWLEGVASYVQSDSVGIQVAYYATLPRFRVFPLAPAQRLQQTQGMKRVFPI